MTHLKKLVLILVYFWIAKQTSGMLWDTVQAYQLTQVNIQTRPSFTVVRMSEGMTRAERQ